MAGETALRPDHVDHSPVEPARGDDANLAVVESIIDPVGRPPGKHFWRIDLQIESALVQRHCALARIASDVVSARIVRDHAIYVMTKLGNVEGCDDMIARVVWCGNVNIERFEAEWLVHKGSNLGPLPCEGAGVFYFPFKYLSPVTERRVRLMHGIASVETIQ